jgi:hypothetical protein
MAGEHLMAGGDQVIDDAEPIRRRECRTNP